MRKYIIAFGMIFLLLIGGTGILASDKIELLLFPAKITINSQEIIMEDDNLILNYNGHAYVPIKWLSENLNNFSVNYNNKSKTISIFTGDIVNHSTGPMVTLDQAKLVAFETYYVKKLNTISTKYLTQEELKQRPEDPTDITPVYYVIDAINDADEKVTICVSTNKREHNFILK
jgi:hypothetical protein